MESVPLRLSGGQNRLFYHRGSQADQSVMGQMFQNQDYSFKRLRRGAELNVLHRSLDRPLILDAGANIGASVCWFASSFPGTHVVAFEPDAANFDLLRRNTEGMDVDLHEAALGSRDGRARLVDPGEGEWGYRTADDAGGEIERISISRIVEEKRGAGFSPFIAKIDIEGGEGDLFEPPNDWVQHFPLLIVELHDWLLPGQGLSRSFLKCIAALDRDFVHIGENIFSIRNPVSGP